LRKTRKTTDQDLKRVDTRGGSIIVLIDTEDIVIRDQDPDSAIIETPGHAHVHAHAHAPIVARVDEAMSVRTDRGGIDQTAKSRRRPKGTDDEAGPHDEKEREIGDVITMSEDVEKSGTATMPSPLYLQACPS